MSKEPQLSLYLGLEIPKNWTNTLIIHLPLIQIAPRPFYTPDILDAYHHLAHYSHLIFTSKTAVNLFYAYGNILNLSSKELMNKPAIAVGSTTANAISAHQGRVELVAEEETAEGVVAVLEKLPLEKCSFFWPHAAGSRPVIRDFFQMERIRSVNYRECIFYETLPLRPAIHPDFDTIKELIFTSPSTVDAFLEFFGPIPQDKLLTAIGPVTRAYLEKNVNN